MLPSNLKVSPSAYNRKTLLLFHPKLPCIPSLVSMSVFSHYGKSICLYIIRLEIPPGQD